jgi:hypothetical protein
MGFQLYATFREVRENRAERILVDFSLSTEAGILKNYCSTNTNSGSP